MKNFSVICPTEVVAVVRVSNDSFYAAFNGIPSNLEKAFKEKNPEYKKCSSDWTWETGDEFVMKFMSPTGECIFEEK